MSPDDLAEFLKTLTNNELETLYQDTIKECALIQYETNDPSILRHLLSKIEDELQIRHLREAGLQAWNAGYCLIDKNLVRCSTDENKDQLGAMVSLREDVVNINKELSEFPKLQRFKKDLL